jgi:hypothetical protein
MTYIALGGSVQKMFPEEPITLKPRDDAWDLREELNAESRALIYAAAKSTSAGDIDAAFISAFFDRFQESIGDFDGGALREYIEEDVDDGNVLFVDGDLSIPTLDDLDNMEITTLIIDGDLSVEHGIYTENSPLEKLVVSGTMRARSLWNTGYLLVGKDAKISDSTWGEYPDNGAFVCGDLETNFFHGRHRFEVGGKLRAQSSIGYPAAEDFEDKPLRDFLMLLNPDLVAQLGTFGEDALNSCGEEFWKLVDRASIRQFVTLSPFMAAAPSPL